MHDDIENELQSLGFAFKRPEEHYKMSFSIEQLRAKGFNPDGSRIVANQPQTRSGVESEADLHAQILEECKRRNWLAFHGSMAHRTFRTEGEPDFVILRDAGRVLMVECKSKRGKLSPNQIAIAAWAKRLGHEIHLVKTLEEFKRII